jgi:hypothetical protein
MPRLFLCLRVFTVAVALPVIALYIVGAALWCALSTLVLDPGRAQTSSLRLALRLWMSVLDWTKGLPVGYSYWEQYLAPHMLNEIEVHHDD